MSGLCLLLVTLLLEAFPLREATVAVEWTTARDETGREDLRAAAADLTNVLFRTTGVHSPIRDAKDVATNATHVIWLGDTAAARAAGVGPNDLRLGDWRVKVEQDRVFLYGRTGFASAASVTEFAERHCGYLFLSEDGDDPCTFCPELTVPVADVTVRPAIYQRNIFHKVDYYQIPKDRPQRLADFCRRRRCTIDRNRDRMRFEFEGAWRPSQLIHRYHSTFDYLPPETWFKPHPEYYSMGADGLRHGVRNAKSQLCYTHPETRRLVYDALVRFVEADRAKYGADAPCVYSLSQMDNCDYLCLCPNCRKVIGKYNRVPGGHKDGGDAGLQLEFVNDLARRIRERHPDVRLAVYAYNSTENVPREGAIRPEPNVIVEWCDLYSRSDHTLPLTTPDHYNADQLTRLRAWTALTHNVRIWDYQLGESRWPECLVDAIAADMRTFAAEGVQAVFVEDYGVDQPFFGLNAYVQLELMIDPARDVEQLVRNWCRLYGRGADEMVGAIGFLRRITAEKAAPSAMAWHNRQLPWLNAADFRTLAGMVKCAYDQEHQGVARARMAGVLASVHQALMPLLRQTGDVAGFVESAEAFRAFAAEYAIGSTSRAWERKRLKARAEETLELATLSFDDLPEELRRVPAEDLRCLDYHAVSYRSEPDDRSSRGRTFASKKAHAAKLSGFPLRCGVYDRDTKAAFNFTLSAGDVRPDGKYHWARVGRIRVGRNSWFWFPENWDAQIFLRDCHTDADGVAVDPNVFDLWASIRLEGPAYVPGSTAENRVSVDRLALARKRDSDFQRRIDDAAAAGGGVVTVPPGRYEVKGLYLRSNVELRLEKGAILLASASTNDYRRLELPYSEGAWMAVVMSVGETNVAVTGEGEINGNGLAFPQPLSQGGNQEGTRPRGLFFANCADVRLSDFMLRDSACWGIVFKCCDGVVARNVTVDSHANSNNDGFDIEARNVLIENCDVDSGDDAFCIKSNHPHFTVENVTVRRCVGRSHCNVFKLGTASHGTMRNIAFEHCRAEAPRRDCANTKPGFEGKRFHAGRERPGYPNGTSVTAIAIENVDGGRVEGVRYEDIELDGTRTPIFIRAGRRTGRSCGTPPGNQYVFRDISLKNIRGSGTDPIASSVTGVDGCRIGNVVFENVAITCSGAGEGPSKAALSDPVPNRDGGYPDPRMFLPCILPAYGLYVDKVDGILLKNVSFSLKEGTEDLRPKIAYGASVVVKEVLTLGTDSRRVGDM